MRLRTTLVGVLLCIALVLSGTIYVGFAMHKNDIVAQEREEIRRTAAVVANRIDTRIDTTIAAVELWASNGNIIEGGRAERFAALNTFVSRTAFDRAATYATNGSLLSIAGPTLSADDLAIFDGAEYAGEPFFELARAGETYVSEPERSLVGGYVIHVATPIRGPDDDVIGVFGGSFDLERRSLFAEVSSIGPPTDNVTITADGQELFAEGTDPERSLLANATVSRTGWTVTVTRPRATVAGQLRGATALQVGGVAIGLLVVALVGFWVSRTTLTKIRTLLDALTDLEGGEYRTDLDLGSIEEWHRISDRFNAVSRTLEQRDSQLRVLNRVLRHNLRNDMNVITARAERLLSDEETPRSIKEDVRQIHTTATRLINTSEHARTLYDDLLTQPKQAVEPIDVAAMVRERTAALAAQFPEATIETDLETTAWALDSAALPIVVEEIVRNAIIHNDLPQPDRRVTVSVTGDAPATAGVDAERETRVEVADNGPGIPMVEEALLTDELEETPIEHGSGLGVWLVNWLIDRIGGTVSVTTGVDRGTTVTIHLPAPADPPDGNDDGA